MTRRSRGPAVALALSLASAQAGHASLHTVSYTCGDTLVTSMKDIEPSLRAIVRSGILWDPEGIHRPGLSPGQAIRLAYERLIVSGIAGAKATLVAVRFEDCCREAGMFYWGEDGNTPVTAGPWRFYVVEFFPLEPCSKAGSRDLSVNVPVLGDGTVILPRKAGQPPIRIPPDLEAPPIELVRSALKGIAATGWTLERHVRRVALDLQRLTGYRGHPIRVHSQACDFTVNELRLDIDSMAADRFWFRRENDWPRLSPGKALRLAKEAARARALPGVESWHAIGLELRPAGTLGGWYYQVRFWVHDCPDPPSGLNLAVAAVLMDGTVLLPPR